MFYFILYFLHGLEAIAKDFGYLENLRKNILNYPITKAEKGWVKKNDTKIKVCESCLRNRAVITINFKAKDFFRNMKEGSEFYEPSANEKVSKRLQFEHQITKPSATGGPHQEIANPVHGSLFLMGNTVGINPEKLIGGAPGYGADVFVLKFDSDWMRQYVTLSAGDSIRSEIKLWAQKNPDSFLGLFDFLTPLFLVRAVKGPDKGQKPIFDPSLSDQNLRHFEDWCQTGGDIKKGSYVEVQIHQPLSFDTMTDLVLHEPASLQEYRDPNKTEFKALLERFLKKHQMRLHATKGGI